MKEQPSPVQNSTHKNLHLSLLADTVKSLISLITPDEKE